MFDGRSNLYVKDPLPIGNDQVRSTSHMNIFFTIHVSITGWIRSDIRQWGKRQSVQSHYQVGSSGKMLIKADGIDANTNDDV